MVTKLIIVGAGGHGQSVAEIALADRSVEVVGFVDDGASQVDSVFNVPVLGTSSALSDLRSRASGAIVAIGNNVDREAMQRKLIESRFSLVTLIHSSSIVSPSAKIGRGSAIMAGAIVGTKAVLGEGVIVNSGAVVDHHCVVEDFAHLGTNACMAGGSSLGVRAWIQAGSAIGYSVRVENDGILAPGAALQMTKAQ